jgi:hypothetical protein
LVRLLEFAGAKEFNLHSISGKVVSMEGIIVNNQGIMLKMSRINMNLLLKVQTDLKDGINWMKKTMESGIKFEFEKAVGMITNEMNIKLSIFQGSVDNNIKKLRKDTGGSFDRMQIAMDNMNNNLSNMMNAELGWDPVSRVHNRGCQVFFSRIHCSRVRDITSTKASGKLPRNLI